MPGKEEGHKYEINTNLELKRDDQCSTGKSGTLIENGYQTFIAPATDVSRNQIALQVHFMVPFFFSMNLCSKTSTHLYLFAIGTQLLPECSGLSCGTFGNSGMLELIYMIVTDAMYQYHFHFYVLTLFFFFFRLLMTQH